ncbi:hypothetical protein IKG24_01570 [Candidatus Saccharibacteria bacterium]|nr:hypothetical protein [Candidatus Saccharibacteria bacterium]
MEVVSPYKPAPINGLDSDFHFYDPGEEKRREPNSKINRLRPKERVFLARLGAAAITAALITSSASAIKSHPVGRKGINEIDAPIPKFKPIVEIVKTSPAMSIIEGIDEDYREITSELPVESDEPPEPVYPEELDLPIPVAKSTSVEKPSSTAQTPDWDGTILNAKNGHINGPTGDETYYDLPMNEIVARMHRLGYDGDYWVREDGVKMLGDYVMVAANLKVHPRGSIVETSLGTGIVCDTGGFAKEHPKRLDIATNWTKKQ